MILFDSFPAFVRKATGHSPYLYQERLALGEGVEVCESRIIDVATGCGKTRAALLSWLWNAVINANPAWPRRLVYCLPMRTLVEQTYAEAKRILDAEHLDLLWDGNRSSHAGKVGLHLLMGGEPRDNFDYYPEHPAILIGTQDLLLSRALNRGYALGRYRWPLPFALLNNDALWILDEVQLMGSGLSTTIQLDGFREKLWAPLRPCKTWWMSATVVPDDFSTRDRRDLACAAPGRFHLSEAEKADPGLVRRLRASKSLAFTPKNALPTAADILREHAPGTITLVVANTVAAARDLHQSIAAGPAKVKRGAPPVVIPHLVLLHSRFRQDDRKSQFEALSAFQAQQEAAGGVVPEHAGLIVVSTQVIEAGFDLSAHRLWSETAPWASIVQRLGRLNRTGLAENAQAFFWNNEKPGKGARLGPYDESKVKIGRELLAEVIAAQDGEGGYRAALDRVMAGKKSQQALSQPHTYLVRPDDVHQLFSTEPDLAGGFTNISPFVRDSDANADVYVLWREFKEKRDADDTSFDNREPATDRRELVSVPIHELKKFAEDTKARLSIWNDETDRWEYIGFYDVVPGMELLLPTRAGGYSAAAGWTGDKSDRPEAIDLTASKSREERHALDRDPESERDWESLTEHTQKVAAELKGILDACALDPKLAETLLLAADWHDLGKAHPLWQEAVRRVESPVHPAPANKKPWAKFVAQVGKQFRPAMRHEAVSLLAVWPKWIRGERCPRSGAAFTALALYLIGAHHGYLRTVIRGTIASRQPGSGEDVFGVAPKDAALGPVAGWLDGEVSLPLALKEFSGQSHIEGALLTVNEPGWNAVVAELLGRAWKDDPVIIDAVPAGEPRALGPFALAYLEAILRAADCRASMSNQPASAVEAA